MFIYKVNYLFVCFMSSGTWYIEKYSVIKKNLSIQSFKLYLSTIGLW